IMDARRGPYDRGSGNFPPAFLRFGKSSFMCPGVRPGLSIHYKVHAIAHDVPTCTTDAMSPECLAKAGLANQSCLHITELKPPT
ncbi:hypothetical protein NDU88_004669, partial [Pleurodeles waltl]